MRHAKDDSGQKCVVFDDGTRAIWDEEKHGPWREGVQQDEPVAVADEVEVEPEVEDEPVEDEPEDVEEDEELSPDEAAAIERAEAEAAAVDPEIADDEPTEENTAPDGV